MEGFNVLRLIISLIEVERLLEWFGSRNYATVSVICCRVVRMGRKMELGVLVTSFSLSFPKNEGKFTKINIHSSKELYPLIQHHIATTMLSMFYVFR